MVMLFFSVKIDADPKPKTEPPIGGAVLKHNTQHYPMKTNKV